MKILAGRVGLRIKRVFYDTHSQHFWGSEQYRRDIPLLDERSYCLNPGRSPFTPADIAVWDARCRMLNEDGRADAAGFVLVAAKRARRLARAASSGERRRAGWRARHRPTALAAEPRA